MCPVQTVTYVSGRSVPNTSILETYAYPHFGELAVAARVALRTGDYPLLSGGDVNLYSLFVERGMTLVKSDGMVGLLTPSGIASDLTAAKFFKGVLRKAG